MANQYMKAAGCPFDAMFDIKMPDTWTPIYDLSDKEHVAEINHKADEQMQDRHPVWVKDRCAMCLGCLHRCPRFAIQCGDRTRIHGQYQHSA